MNREFEQYFSTVEEIFKKIMLQQSVFSAAAQVCAESIAQDKLLHVIGSGGHSSMAAEEIFWRAGGLAPVNAILDAGVNLIHGAKRTNIIERTEGYAKKVFDAYQIGKTNGEVLIIANAYGINALSIECALEAKKRGVTSIGVTSTGFSSHLAKNHPSRHSSGKNLFEETDFFIDCHLPFGDTVVDIEGLEQKTGPTATLCNVFTLNLLIIEIVKYLLQMGIKPPLWMSANMPGGDESNVNLFEKYGSKIKHLL